MTIKKYQGKTKEEAIENAKAELGPRVVIMNVKEVHPKGFLGSFKKATYEVTAAVEDEFVPKGHPILIRPPYLMRIMQPPTSRKPSLSMSILPSEGTSRFLPGEIIRKQKRAGPGDLI